jgi:RNA-directed DNA polymerase
MHGTSLRENREILESPVADGATGRIGKAGGQTPMTHDPRKSDGPIVPTKLPNKAASAVAEVVEGRGPPKGNSDQQNAPRTQSRDHGAPSALDRVRQAARKDRKARLTALFHHVTIDLLRDAFQALRKDAAPGVDGQTWQQYQADLDVNLRDLHTRLHRGAYRARPSRRVYIPKADGRQRPLGIASLEDKVVQRAVCEVLNAVYEGDFLGFSYGFRPGRSQHDALDALNVGLIRRKVSWMLDADVRGFFDTIDHGWLMKFIEHRIADARILRLVRKWLAAGVMENGSWSLSEQGTPQGATISPLLANIYLHYVFDLWIQRWRTRPARGDVVVVRYADDFVVGFQRYGDAKSFHEELRARLRSFSLELHQDKTRLLRFGRFARQQRAERGEGRPETFNFLGFTHVCGENRKGNFTLVRRTLRTRLAAKLREVKTELMRRRHLPIQAQGEWLGRVVRGHFAYYAVPGNHAALDAFRSEVKRHWKRALSRRSQRTRATWPRMHTLAERWLPRTRILHPWPQDRFDVKTRGKSPVR